MRETEPLVRRRALAAAVSAETTGQDRGLDHRDPEPVHFLHRFRCKPRHRPHYGEAYQCARCGRRWVSTIALGGPYYWSRVP